jgi:hypothetical protein
LNDLIGQYLRGDVPVYRGTVEAHDDEGQLHGGVDGTIANSPALAALRFASAARAVSPCQANLDLTGNAAILELASLGGDGDVTLEQIDSDPATTWASLVGGNGCFLAGTCSHCAPVLAEKPAVFAVDRLMAVGALPQSAGAGAPKVDVHTVVTTDLHRVSPCSLTLDDLRVINSRMGEDPSWNAYQRGQWSRLVPVADEMVLNDSEIVMSPDGATCTPYTADLFFKRDRPADYGVRNLKLGMPQPCEQPY